MANQSENKPRTVLNALINNTTGYANLDYNYGPYANMDEAVKACAKLKAQVGFTCGVLSGSKVKEYLVRGGATAQSAYGFQVGDNLWNQLILKLEMPEPGGSGVDLSLSVSHSEPEPEADRPYTTVTIKNNENTVGSFKVYDGASGTGGSGITIPNSEGYPLTSNGSTLLKATNIKADTIVGQHGLMLKVKGNGIYLGNFTKPSGSTIQNEDTPGDFVLILGGKDTGGCLRFKINGNVEVVASGEVRDGDTVYAPGAPGKITAAGGFYESSDARLKTDIQTAELDYDQLLDKIRPVLYHWKFDQDGPLELGFIAQEIQELVPQVVSGEKQLSVNYAKLSTVALGACKHLMQRLDLLENRVKDIEEKLK